jgi:hypothetical protein
MGQESNGPAGLWAIRRPVALKAELIREVWRIYHLPPEQPVAGSGEKAQSVSMDSAFDGSQP